MKRDSLECGCVYLCRGSGDGGENGECFASEELHDTGDRVALIDESFEEIESGVLSPLDEIRETRLISERRAVLLARRRWNEKIDRVACRGGIGEISHEVQRRTGQGDDDQNDRQDHHQDEENQKKRRDRRTRTLLSTSIDQRPRESQEEMTRLSRLLRLTND